MAPNMSFRLLQKISPQPGEEWTKSLGAIIGAAGFLWGTWTFFFKEILTPAVAPVNISLGLEVRSLRAEAETRRQIPVLLTASAKNSSGKILNINKSFWVAFAVHANERKNWSVAKDINRQMSLTYDSQSLAGTSSHYQSSKDTWEVVALGPIFDSDAIRPDEEIKAQKLILVPEGDKEGKYDLLRVQVVIPSFSKKSGLARDGLVRVIGGVGHPSANVVRVGFCRAERNWTQHGLRWFFDKFILPSDNLSEREFRDSAFRYCPTIMSDSEREQIGGQVFTSTHEVPLKLSFGEHAQ